MATATAPPPHRSFAFSLRTLFVLLTVAAVVLGMAAGSLPAMDVAILAFIAVVANESKQRHQSRLQWVARWVCFVALFWLLRWIERLAS